MPAESKKDITKMATIYAQEGKWDKAIAEYKKLITLDPTDYNVHNMLGDAYSKKSDDALAYQEYILSAETYLKQGLSDKANIVYKKIGKLDSEKLPEKERQKQILIKKLTMAEKFIESGEIDKAIESYKEIIKLNPANFETYQKLGELYAEKGDKASAQEYYRKIVDIYFKNRLYKKALPIYQKILEMTPEDITAHEKIAEIYEREANESDAKREYLFLAEHYWKEKNIEKTDYFAQKAVDFKSIEAHFFKGAALYEKKEMGEAKKELEMLLKFKANHGGALTVMASIYRDTGQTDEALSTFDKVIKAEPENTDALEALADLYMKKGNSKDAGTRLMMAVNILNGKQDYGKAASLLNRLLAQEPENLEVLSKLGDIFGKQNKKKEAADVFIRMSDLYKKSNLPDKASEYYKMAENMDPAHPKIVERAKKLVTEPVPKAQAAPPPPKAEPPKPEPAKPEPPRPQAAIQQPKAEIKPPFKMMQQEVPEIEVVEPPPLKITRSPSSFAAPKPPAPKPPTKAAPAKREEQDIPEQLPDIDIFGTGGKKPSEKISDMERDMQPQSRMFVPQTPSEDDVPSLIAMADNYIRTGSFDEAIEMYQRALAMDPDNSDIKKKLTVVYSQYAGVPAPDSPEAQKKKREEEEKKRRAEAIKKQEEESAKKKKDEEDRKKKEEEAKGKKEEEEKRKKEEEEKRKKYDEAKKKEEEAGKKEEEEKKKKAAEEEKKKKDEEAKRKKEEEEKKKKPEAGGDEVVDEALSDDFVTVTTAEIFIKQGLFTEAEKILSKILKKDSANIEAKMKLDEMKKLQQESEQKGENVMDEDMPKGKQSKVTYI
jgi:tetratricopeptide (TPR) repeat protein